MGLGHTKGVTYDYIRRSTTTLFAALDIATGRVLTQCSRRQRLQEYQGFLENIEANITEDLDVHLNVDNYSIHKYSRVKQWLGNHPRYHVH